MKLTRITQALAQFLDISGAPEPGAAVPDILSIHYDSRSVKPGGLFVAVKGLVADGHRFIADAVTRGAVAVVAENGASFETPDVPLILTSDSRKALAIAAGEFYGHPSSYLHLTGVTGTNGKTSTTYLLESIFREAGFETGVIGTINCRYGGRTFPNPMTTPESLDLQKILADMVEAGVTHAIMEVSSHAIDLDRVFGLDFDLGVFTNLSQDHLDYHGTMENYWDCKKRLFTEYLPDSGKDSNAVVNITDSEGTELASAVRVPIYTTGTDHGDIRMENARVDIHGIEGELVTPLGRINVSCTGIGQHNIENILSAAGAALASGASLIQIGKGIAEFNVPGRLERVPNSHGFHVFVDYAHTPDGLLNVLETLRPLTRGRLITVFGCGGDRDKGKRPKMAQVAEEYSDLVIVTSDNPRTEDPSAIIGDILEGLDGQKLEPSDFDDDIRPRGYVVEPDRRSAIAFAIHFAKANDTVLIAGKGHETYQILNTGTIDFDDRIEARKALETHE